MPAIYISNQEAKDVVEALEWARDRAQAYACGKSIFSELNKTRYRKYSRLMENIKRRIK
jgi:hypothetical protein